ncbi:apical junction molecule-like [Cotesia glomerata]|uniref:apical junction molecule-like n=1 Tax=Cotesia glomerata TaxID=32391 RepID=UPI001D013F60|nr:apical junction molecule-like [Cotesia glomerata]
MSKRTGTWLWSLRKDAVISELAKYQVAIEPKATLPELRFLLRTELNKSRAVNAGRAGRYDQLLIDLDQSKAELDNLDILPEETEDDDPENDDEHLSDEDPEGDNALPKVQTARQRRAHEKSLRAEIEAEERERIEAEEKEQVEKERLEREERERLAREAREKAEKKEEKREQERVAREAAEQADRELRERLRQEIRVRLLRENKEQRAYELQLDAREARMKYAADQRKKAEREARINAHGNNRDRFLSLENER